MVTLDYQVLKSAKGSIHMGGYRILLLYPNLQITDAPCYLVCLNDLRLGREAAPLQGGRELYWGQFWRLRWGWKEVAKFFSAVGFRITCSCIPLHQASPGMPSTGVREVTHFSSLLVSSRCTIYSTWFRQPKQENGHNL